MLSGLRVMSEETLGNTMPSICNSRLPRRIKITEQQLEKITLEDLIRSWHEQDLYIDFLESQVSNQEAEIGSLRESEERMRQQHLESSHREKVLVRRLATKEQEMQEYANQIAEFKAGQTAGSAALRSALLDPAVNLLLQRLRAELTATRSRLEETQNELSAWKFTPDSNTGKRLMAKCRLLYQENEELGRMISSGRLAKLEGELALQKSFSNEVKKSQSELDEFLQDLDEDVEGMQSTIYYLQQELRKTKDAYQVLQQMKNSTNSELSIICEKTTVTLKEQQTCGLHEVKSEQCTISCKSSPSLSKPSSPHQVEFGLKSENSELNTEMHGRRTPEEGFIKEELDEENESEQQTLGDSRENFGCEKDSDTGKKCDVELSGCNQMKAVDETEVTEDHENIGKGGMEEVDDQDSRGELMIEVESDQGDNEDEEDQEEKYLHKSVKDDQICANGWTERYHVDEKLVGSDSKKGTRKRSVQEVCTHSSDEDSDDAPLIKKVRRSHDQT